MISNDFSRERKDRKVKKENQESMGKMYVMHNTCDIYSCGGHVGSCDGHVRSCDGHVRSCDGSREIM